MKQVFKNEILTRTKVKNNILRVWNSSTSEDRYDWYGEANKIAQEMALTIAIHDDTIIDLPQATNVAAGMIAALSPMVNWERNIELARMAMYTNPENMPCLKANARKAYQIMRCDGSDEAIMNILKGKKVTAFFLNICYPEKAISLTIDRHALSIALGRKLTRVDENEGVMNMTVAQYKFFEECYRYAAAKVNTNPLVLQSATWIVWKRK